MKNILLVCVMLFCGIMKATAQYQATVVSHTRDAVTLRCTGYGKKAAMALADAEKSAVRTVMFEGVSGTVHSMPLVQGSMVDVETGNKDFFAAFYSGMFRNFVESSVIVTPFGKNEVKAKCITADVCVRVNRLREYLEDNGVIRKFGL